jgi:hypothetical protein
VLTTMQQIGGAMGVAIVGVIFFGLIGGRADTSSAAALPQLRAALVAQHVPDSAIPAALQSFQTCFHDRANENDPSVAPPSCVRAQQQSPSPAATRAFSQAAATAMGDDFESSLNFSLLYQVAVFAGSFLMVFFIPAPSRAAGWGGAGAGAH